MDAETCLNGSGALQVIGPATRQQSFITLLHVSVNRLFHSVVLLSLTVVGLTSCSGPNPALSKGARSSAQGAPPSAPGTPPPAVGQPPPDPNAARDAYWKIAMQSYKPPAMGAEPETAAPLQQGPIITANTAPPTPTISTTPPVSTPAIADAPAKVLNPADIPYAIPVPGKRGIVKSPFDPNGRPIDVRDFNPGQLSQCPYSGKIFRVPPLK